MQFILCRSAASFSRVAHRSLPDLITCNLTKPESTLDQIRKTFTKLPPTDAAMIATALVLSGRYALAVVDEQPYSWPDDYTKLQDVLLRQLQHIHSMFEAPAKKVAKTAPEEEPVEMKIGLISNYAAGERVLSGRKDLKTLFGDLVNGGVEYLYAPTDIGWQWAFDRINWSTISTGELTRRIKLKAMFQGEATGVEMGSGAPRKRAKKAVVEAPEPVSVEES